MPSSPISMVIQHLRRVSLRESVDLTDGQLLEDFVSRAETSALEALVLRHGPMVWGVCQRVLGNDCDAEDAFQATFLVLVRKAASIQPAAKVGNWLYGVAHQTALKARTTRGKRQARERPMMEIPEAGATDQHLWTDLQPLLDREVSRLPATYRTVVVLCDLEGKTKKEAARQLGCPEGTVASRLARARTILAKRLARHAPTVSSGALAAVLSQQAASACVPAAVLTATIKAVTLVAAGQAAACVASAKAAALAQAVLKSLFVNKLKSVLAFLLVLGTVAFGGGLLAQHLAGAHPEQAIPRAGPQANKTPDPPERLPTANASQAVRDWYTSRLKEFHAARYRASKGPDDPGVTHPLDSELGIFAVRQSYKERDKLPEEIRRAFEFYHRHFEEKDIGFARAYLVSAGGTATYAIRVHTDGDDGYLEVYDHAGTCLTAGRTYIEVVAWGSRAWLRPQVAFTGLPPELKDASKRTLWGRDLPKD